MRPRVLFLLLLCCSQSSCFNTREPANPTGDSGAWLVPTSETELLQNMRNAVQNLSVENYRRLFAEGQGRYQFQPQPQLAQGNSLFADWGVAEEVSYLQNLNELPLSQENNNLSFTQLNKTATANRVEIQQEYRLDIAHGDTSFAPTHFEGLMTLAMERNDQEEFEITRWEDNKLEGSDFQTWSALKEEFAVR